MTQEIITYIIIAVAVFYSAVKIYRNFSKKKIIKTAEEPVNHHCSDCPAECVLRDASSQTVKDNSELCIKK